MAAAASSTARRIFVVDVAPCRATICLEGLSLTFANTLRRFLLATVPTLAVVEVMMDVNTSHFSDEFIAHRLGLVPLMFNGRIPAGRFILDLDVAVPKASTSAQDVTSMHLMPHDPRVAPCHYGDPDEATLCAGLDAGVAITKLAPGQHLRARCYAVRGTAEDHAKFGAVTSVLVDDGSTFVCPRAPEDIGPTRIHVETVGQVEVRTVITRALEALHIALRSNNTIKRSV